VTLTRAHGTTRLSSQRQNPRSTRTSDTVQERLDVGRELEALRQGCYVSVAAIEI
jgi:hypothetical protein